MKKGDLVLDGMYLGAATEVSRDVYPPRGIWYGVYRVEDASHWLPWMEYIRGRGPLDMAVPMNFKGENWVVAVVKVATQKDNTGLITIRKFDT